MSIGENWRQISPGTITGGAGGTGGVADSKFAQSNAADQLSGNGEGRTFSQYMFGEDGFEFTDVLDVINPLQHIPGVGMIYRSLTGDEIGNGARVAGGGLFGGVFGLAGAAIDAVVDAVTGDDTGSHVMAFVEDSFGGSGIDDGTAVADATDATGTTNNPQNSMAQNGAYQGDLVLPWMSGYQAQQSVSAAEQATIVQSAPTAPVDQTVLASADATGGLAVKASDLNVPWAQGMQAAQAAPSPQSPVNPASVNSAPAEAEIASAPTPPTTDPAELTVAMASAGTANPASSLAQTISSSSTANEPVRRPMAKDADTVWARAASSGRLSRQTNHFAISAEMAAHETKYAKINAVKAETAEREASKIQTTAADGTPLSAAEMAARFNAALGRDKAQTMAADAVASSNPVADDGQMTARETARSTENGSAAVANASASDDPANHPLLQQASSNMNGDAPVGAWFSQTMMDGLKKYQAMQQNNPAQPGNSI
ncbi:hypothetical protein HED22_05595 [Thalassospira sp. HF15]|uniref:hypothetical protein n=1 Tax=Thalassospira sp. HF15 TaxID=2722755 RepID=UPI0014307EE8|nr:hypothetical protein [Thalassospira sp. HF15]NIY75112.1 hypothetical protein [Thalassospira sp. HF15]